MAEPAMWTAGGAVVAASVSALFAWGSSRAATGPANSQANLEWVKQAHTEATEAKTEARQAKKDAEATEAILRKTQTRMDAQDRRLRQVDAVAHELMDWIRRVLIKAQAVDPSMPHDAAVRDLLRVINGGPASMTDSQIRERNP